MNIFPANGLGQAATLTALRRFLLVLFLLGLLGTGTELLLVGHIEELWQTVPVFLMAVSLVLLGWVAAEPKPASIRFFQGTMVLFIISGAVGLWFHYQANTEFELEMYPSIKGWPLFWKAIQGKAPPTLAPGMMIELGLLGLAYAYRHPGLAGTAGNKSHDKGGP